jgi:SAM-dependent methyltransferase
MSQDLQGARPGRAFDTLPAYLRADRFMQTLLGGQALLSGFETGLIEFLEAHPQRSFVELEPRGAWDEAGLRLLLEVLSNSGVVVSVEGGYRLSDEFSEVLPFRDLMRAKLQFAQWVTSDCATHFTALLTQPEAYFARSALFELFDYSRCLDFTPDNVVHTRRWVELTTTLTRYEAPECLARFDCRRYRRVLDVGGNSGEFVRQMCVRNPTLSATVLDLPVVCELGREYVDLGDEGDRIEFVDADQVVELDGDRFDLVCFKSMLHDWPEERVVTFLKQATDRLEPGGRLLIFERGPFDVSNATLCYSNLSTLLFFRSYRGPELYRQLLSRLGYEDIEVQRVNLDMPFFVLSALWGEGEQSRARDV